MPWVVHPMLVDFFTPAIQSVERERDYLSLI